MLRNAPKGARMKLLIPAVAVLLVVTSRHLRVDARAVRSLVGDVEKEFDEWKDELFGDGESIHIILICNNQ